MLTREELAAKIYTTLSLDDFDNFDDAADYAVEAADALISRLRGSRALTTSEPDNSDDSKAKTKFKLF
jgi:hypothetical protein